MPLWPGSVSLSAGKPPACSRKLAGSKATNSSPLARRALPPVSTKLFRSVPSLLHQARRASLGHRQLSDNAEGRSPSQGNTTLPRREAKPRLAPPILVCSAVAFSNPLLREKLKSLVKEQRPTTERYAPPRLRPIEADVCTRSVRQTTL